MCFTKIIKSGDCNVPYLQIFYLKMKIYQVCKETRC